MSCTAFPSGVKNTPVEINEASAPIVIWRKDNVQDEITVKVEVKPEHEESAGELLPKLGKLIEASDLTEPQIAKVKAWIKPNGKLMQVRVKEACHLLEQGKHL